MPFSPPRAARLAAVLVPGVLAGVATGLAELAGYYLTAAARGYPAGPGIVLFWAACTVLVCNQAF